VIGHALKEVQTLPGEVVPLLRFKKVLGASMLVASSKTSVVLTAELN